METNIEEGKISVIIPVYNVEKYLDQCLESVCGQTWKNMEIILVDDGSIDRSPQICEAWKKKDCRVHVLRQRNSGAGAARNTGLAYVSGEFVAFVDSDDCIEKNALEQAYRLAKKKEAEIVCFGIHNVKADGEIYQTIIPRLEKNFFCDREIQTKLLPEMITKNPYDGKQHFPFLALYTAIYSTRLIRDHNWEIVSERMIAFEDCFSLLILYSYAKRVAVLSAALYSYRDNAASLTHTLKKNRYKSLCDFHEKTMNLCYELGYGEEIRKRISYIYIDNVIGLLKQILSANESKRERMRYFYYIVQDKRLHSILDPLSYKAYPFKKRLLILGLKKKWGWLLREMIAFNRKRR